MANSRREVVFVPTGLLASGGLEPGALQAGGHRKTIGHSGILLVVEIPGLAIGRGDEGRGFTKVRADGWPRLGIWSQQAGRSADPDGFAGSPLQRRIALILSISLGLSFDGQLNSLMERIKQGTAELTRPMLPLMNSTCCGAGPRWKASLFIAQAHPPKSQVLHEDANEAR